MHEVVMPTKRLLRQRRVGVRWCSGERYAMRRSSTWTKNTWPNSFSRKGWLAFARWWQDVIGELREKWVDRGPWEAHPKRDHQYRSAVLGDRIAISRGWEESIHVLGITLQMTSKRKDRLAKVSNGIKAKINTSTAQLSSPPVSNQYSLCRRWGNNCSLMCYLLPVQSGLEWCFTRWSKRTP